MAKVGDFKEGILYTMEKEHLTEEIGTTFDYSYEYFFDIILKLFFWIFNEDSVLYIVMILMVIGFVYYCVRKFM